MFWIVALMLSYPFLVFGLNAGLNRMKGEDPHVTPFRSGIMGLVLMISAYLVTYFSKSEFDAFDFGAGFTLVSVYAVCVAFINWFVFAVSDASMHIRILMVIERLGSASSAQIQDRFNKASIISYRIPKLIAVGQLGLVDDRLVVKSRSVILFAALLRAIRRVLSIPARPELATHSPESPGGHSGTKRECSGKSPDHVFPKSYFLRLSAFFLLAHGFLLFCDYRIWDGWIIENIRQHGLWAGALEHYSQAGIQHHFYIHKFLNLFPDTTFFYKAISLLAYLCGGLAACDVLVRSRLLSRDEGLLFGFICLSFPAMKTLGEAAVLPYVLGYALFFIAGMLSFWALPAKGAKHLFLRISSILIFLLSFTFYAMLVYYAAFFALLIYVRYREANGSIVRRATRAILGVVDYGVLPPLFWIFKLTFMSTYGFYVNYNKPQLTPDVFFVALPNFFREAIFRPFLDMPTSTLSLVGFLVLIPILFFLASRVDSSVNPVKAFLFILLGFGLVILGGLPFFLVGRSFFDYTSYDSNNYTLLAPIGVAIALVGLLGLIKILLGDRVGPISVKILTVVLVSHFIVIWNVQRIHYQARGVKEYSLASKLNASVDAQKFSVLVIQDRYDTPRTDAYYHASVVTSMVQALVGDRTKFCFLWPIQPGSELQRLPRETSGSRETAWARLKGLQVPRDTLDKMLLQTTRISEFSEVKLGGQQAVIVILPGDEMTTEQITFNYFVEKYFSRDASGMKAFLSRVLKLDGFVLDPK
jgi:hypothetical protein